jgi:hypothetical protein
MPMKFAAMKLLYLASVFTVADAVAFPSRNGRICSWTCDDNCLTQTTTFNGDGTKTVLVDASACKKSTMDGETGFISWMCSKTTGAIRTECNNNGTGLDASTKCETVLYATYVLDENAPDITIQIHDGQLAGGAITREQACGGIKSSCSNGLSGVYSQVLPLPLPQQQDFGPVKCGDWRCDTVKANCAVVKSISPLGDGTKMVKVDVSGCKNDTISWLCCQTPGCKIVACNNQSFFNPGVEKCDEVANAVFTVPMSATSLNIQYHDGKLFGDVISNAVGFKTCGGVGTSCKQAPTGVCSKTLAL